jgi:DNA-binding transcriptional LysR family regulator
MRRTIPSRSNLLAFEAAARHQSFTHAAAELALTEGAISRQIAHLEEQLGIKLFNRIRKKVVLTTAGRLYSLQVRKAIEQLERDMFNIMAHGGSRGILELAVLPTFGSQWLIPRLGSFYARHPDITINMSARSVMFLFKETPLDAAIHYGQPTWPGTAADYLFGEEIVVICKPELLKEGPFLRAEDILGFPLLHLTSRPDAWRNWLEFAGISGVRAMQGSRYEHFSLLISAARAGLGMALVPSFLIAEELKRGELAVAFDLPMESANAYYLVYPEENLSEIALNVFKEWLLEEAKGYQR